MAELFLIEFKGSRKEYFYNSYHHTLRLKDHVIVQAEQGEDIGVLIKKIEANAEVVEGAKPRSILRPAAREDRTRREELVRKEIECKKEILVLIRKHGLPMKVVDVDCQYDGNKITFYFTADHRVDFRALVRDLAARYRTRIELRQIGVRDEARRNDGYGICGRRQCCNTFIREFAPISTAHAREQELSLNPSKISGNCGRLLCCLRYEVDNYSELKKRFPPVGATISTKAGVGIIQRIDYFREEAICQGGEAAVFRVRCEEILKIEKLPPSKSGTQAAPVGEMPSEDAKEALDQLDELEKLQ